MLDMHTDMEGSAVAVGSLYALHTLRSPLAVDCWLAITENRIGPRAYKPQDVVRAHNGTTIQVIHTDAEGRMVLADALSLAGRNKPRAIIDYATLTGACVYALTERYSGAFTNRPEAREMIEAAGLSSGERVWCFPMDKDYDTDIESTVADVQQCSVDPRAITFWRPASSAGSCQRRSHGCTWISPRVRAMAASRTSRPRSRDSGCATRSTCCDGVGRRRPAPMNSLTIQRPDDWHVHLRDGAALASVVRFTAARFGRAIVMPNLKPPVATTALAQSYRERILAALPADSRFSPLMTLYLTDSTAPEEIDRARRSGAVQGVKLYPAGATTHSDSGVTEIGNTYGVLARMEELGMPLLVHGETARADVDVFDRETCFIAEVLCPLLERFTNSRWFSSTSRRPARWNRRERARRGCGDDHASAPAAQS